MQHLRVHPDNPQLRLVSQAAAIVRRGGVIAYPTDSCYALGCQVGDKGAMERIQRVRNLDIDHFFTLVCRDLSDIATYARVDNLQYRLLKTLTPGPYTLILDATREVPRRLLNPKRRTIGLRVPDSATVRMLLEVLGEPLMSVSLILPESDRALGDPDEIRDALAGQIDALVDGGSCGREPTTVLDLTGPSPVVLRQGRGDTSFLEGS